MKKYAKKKMETEMTMKQEYINKLQADIDESQASYDKYRAADQDSLRRTQFNLNAIRGAKEALKAKQYDIEQDVSPPAPAAYTFKSDNIVDSLQTLQDKLTDRIDALGDKMDTDTRTTVAYIAGLEDSKRNAGHVLSIEMQGELDEINETLLNSARELEEDEHSQKTLASLLEAQNKICLDKNREYTQTQNARKEELQIIARVIAFLEDRVKEAVNKHLSASLVQTALAQLRMESTLEQAKKQELMSFLQAHGGSFSSSAQVMQAAPADKVEQIRRLISNLIMQLQEQANTEAEKKGWCDVEMASNKQERESHGSSVASFKQKIAFQEAELSKVNNAIAKLTESVADLLAQTNSMEDERAAEKTLNDETIDEALTAMADLDDVTTQINDILNNVQAKAPFGEFAPSDAYRGVLSLIRILRTKFTELKVVTEESEKASKELHAQWTEKTGNTREEWETIIHEKETTKESLEEAIRCDEHSLELAETDLLEGEKYLIKLQPPCVDVAVSHEKRLEEQKQELAVLKQALAILSEEV